MRKNLYSRREKLGGERFSERREKVYEGREIERREKV
jgi:hypothetical protein